MAEHIIIPQNSRVTFQDVADTLISKGGKGINTTDASTLFTIEAIKAPFAKYKPQRWPTYFVEGEWWRGPDGLCGFDLSNAVARSFAELVGKYDGNTNGWNYIPPRGKNDRYFEPYRIADFEGYYVNAPSIVRTFIAPTAAYDTDTTKTIAIGLPVLDEHNAEYSLQWSDFRDLKNFYFGVIIYKEDNPESNLHYVTTNISLENRGDTVTINPTKIPFGTYKVAPFISSQSHTMNDPDVDGNEVYYTLPGIIPTELKIMSANNELDVLITTSRDVSSRSIVWTVKVTNNSGKALQLNTNYIHFQDYEDPKDSAGNNTTTIQISNQEVPNGATNYIIGSGTTELWWADSSTMDDNTFARMSLWVRVTLNGSVYDDTQQIIPDFTAGDHELSPDIQY